MALDSQSALRCVLLSDFNVANLGGYLANDPDAPRVEVVATPHGDVIPALMQEDHPCWTAMPDCAVVWTQPQAVSRVFGELAEFRPAALDQALLEVEAFASLLEGARERVRSMFVPTWVVPGNPRGLGFLDLTDEHGIGHAVLAMNARLVERLRNVPGIYVLDTQRWIAAAGRDAHNPKLWYMAKIAFGNEVMREAARDVKAALAALAGLSRKLVILDLDNTLWGDVVGDVGWENLRLGGHDAVGEAFVAFQRELKALSRRGVVLAVVSKNEEAVALEAIERHPEMVLTLNDIARWRINWRDKAANIVELVQELNLGLDSAVFIDDNPAERSRVREALPEVLVPEWPTQPALYRKALLELRCFDTATLSDEDRRRSQSYAAERRRSELCQSLPSMDDWLRSLEQTVEAEPLDAANVARAAQLFNKTNQMNLATRRMTQDELVAWASEPGRRVWTFRVSDRFSDAGLTGILSLGISQGAAEIVDFILSCRVMGRRVEETMLHVAVEFARSLGLQEVRAVYRATAKNKPCLGFWSGSSGFAQEPGTNRFVWDASRAYPRPEPVTLRVGPAT